MKVIIRFEPDFDGAYIYLYEEYDGKKYLAKPINLEFSEIKEAVIMGPTIKIPYYDAKEFMESMAEQLDKDGIKTDKDAKIEGTLEATRFHLEDLRKLLKLNK